MGVAFIGNPIHQETENDDSDWEMNAAEEWIMPPQEIAFIDAVVRAPVDIILAAEEDESDSQADEESDEDYNPDDDDNYEFENDDDDPGPEHYYFDSDGDEDDEDIDYVTYPTREENATEPNKPTTSNAVDPGDSSDTD